MLDQKLRRSALAPLFFIFFQEKMVGQIPLLSDRSAIFLLAKKGPCVDLLFSSGNTQTTWLESGKAGQVDLHRFVSETAWRCSNTSRIHWTTCTSPSM